MPITEEFRQIGFDIIGSAFTVRNETGRGFREVYYKKALAWELQNRGYDVRMEVTIPAFYRGIEIADAYQADIVVDGRAIIETKALTSMGESEARQLITYLKLTRFKLGFLINFGAKDFRTGRLSDPFPYNRGIYRFVNGI